MELSNYICCMARLNTDRQKELEPERMQYAVRCIQDAGYEIIVQYNTSLTFMFKGEFVTLFPYSGWHTGKSIKDGRGLQKLLDQIQP